MPEVRVVGRYRGKDSKSSAAPSKLKKRPGRRNRQAPEPAGPRRPWPDEISTHWGKGSKTHLINVQLRLVIEVAADAALQAGYFATRCGWSATAPTSLPATSTPSPPPDHLGRLHDGAELDSRPQPVAAAGA